MSDYRVEMLPTTYVIDRKGVVKASFVGTVSESRLRDAVDEARLGATPIRAWHPQSAWTSSDGRQVVGLDFDLHRGVQVYAQSR